MTSTTKRTPRRTDLRRSHLQCSVLLNFDYSTGPSKCWLRVFTIETDSIGQVKLVVFTQLPDNTGVSVTNASEFLANLVVEKFQLNPLRTLFFEHYPKDYFNASANPKDHGQETIALCQYTWETHGKQHAYRAAGVQWQHIYHNPGAKRGRGKKQDIPHQEVRDLIAGWLLGTTDGVPDWTSPQAGPLQLASPPAIHADGQRLPTFETMQFAATHKHKAIIIENVIPDDILAGTGLETMNGKRFDDWDAWEVS